MRLIDADALLKDITDYPYGYRGMIKDTIARQPTVDPIKHGHWDNKILDARFGVPRTVARCSNCKGLIWVYAENYEVKYPYCPLCGAKMDERREDET